MASNLPPPREVPTTPFLQTTSIDTIYEINDNEEKGRGAFSRVVVGTHKATNQKRAIKIMLKAGLQGKKADMVAREKEILRRTRHPAIIYLHETIQTPDKVFMVMDLMKGDLFEYIVARKKLPEQEAALIMHQLLSATAYLHENSIIHRDIKPENILINEPHDIKLADFGLAKVIQEWDVKSTPCGTSFYIAPEIIRGIEANGSKPLCTNREEVKYVDLWSCGVVLFILLAGRPPFSGQVKTPQERRALLTKIDKGTTFPDAQWANISDEAKDLCGQLLTQDATLRITAAKAVTHPWFKATLPDEVKESKEEEDSDWVNVDPAQFRGMCNGVHQEGVQAMDTDPEEGTYNVATIAPVDPTAPKAPVGMKSFPGKKAH